MTEDRYSSTAWDSADYSDFQPSAPTLYHLPHPLESPDSSIPHAKSTSPPPRSSTDSIGRSPTSKHRDSPTANGETREGPSTIPNDTGSLVEPSFDENVLRALCELDVCHLVPLPCLRSLIS